MIKTYCCILVVRIAPGQVKHIMKSKDGRTEDWIKTVDSKGNMTWSGIEKKTGIKCQMFYESYCSAAGTWHAIDSMGMESLGLSMGKFRCTKCGYKIWHVT
jgi:hypothetical protein